MSYYMLPFMLFYTSVASFIFFRKNNTFKKGMYIWIGDDNYPNLVIVLPETMGIFDKNMTDFIGKPTREFLNSARVYNLENMKKDEFIAKFGKDLEDFNKNPESTYYYYKTFAINQLYYDLDISREEFDDKYGDFIKDFIKHYKNNLDTKFSVTKFSVNDYYDRLLQIRFTTE